MLKRLLVSLLLIGGAGTDSYAQNVTKAQATTAVQSTITANGRNAITGPILQADLLQMIDVSASWQSAWSSTVQYSYGEIVTYNNDFWIGDAPVTGSAPGTVPGQWTQLGISALPSADIFVGNSSNVASPVPMSGDCSLANMGAITCSSSGGIPIATHVATESALASTTGRFSGATVITDGYYSAGDGGGSTYTWSASNCSISGGDGFSQIPPNSGTGCWLIGKQKDYSILQAGAIGDGVANDSVPLQHILNAGDNATIDGISFNGGNINIPGGQYVDATGAINVIPAPASNEIFKLANPRARLVGAYVNDPTGYTVSQSVMTSGVTTFVNNAYLNPPAACTQCSISGTTLTVLGNGGNNTGPWTVGEQITASGITANTVITALGTGTGGNGTYTVNNSQTLSTRPMTAQNTGGANGGCTVEGTTGTGTMFEATGTVASGVLVGPLVVTIGGNYTVNPQWAATGQDLIQAEPVVPVSGCTGLTGATVTLEMASMPSIPTSVASVNMQANGSGYTAATATFSGGGCGTEPTGTPNLSSGTVASITVNTGGVGCTSPPSITVAGNGTGAAATPLMTLAFTVSNASATSTTPAFQYRQRICLRADTGHRFCGFVSSVNLGTNTITATNQMYDPFSPSNSAGTAWASYGDVYVTGDCYFCSLDYLTFGPPGGVTNGWVGILVDAGASTTAFGLVTINNIRTSTGRLFGIAFGNYLQSVIGTNLDIWGGWNPMDQFTGDGSTTTFTLSERLRRENSLACTGGTAPAVSVNGTCESVTVSQDGLHFTLASAPASGAVIQTSYQAMGAEGLAFNTAIGTGGVTLANTQALAWDRDILLDHAQGGNSINGFIADAGDRACVYEDSTTTGIMMSGGLLGFCDSEIAAVNGSGGMLAQATSGVRPAAPNQPYSPSGAVGQTLSVNPSSNVNLLAGTGVGVMQTYGGMNEAFVQTNPGSPTSVGAVCFGCGAASYSTSFQGIYDLAHGTLGDFIVNPTGEVAALTGMGIQTIETTTGSLLVQAAGTNAALNLNAGTASSGSTGAVNIQQQAVTKLQVNSTQVEDLETASATSGSTGAFAVPNGGIGVGLPSYFAGTLSSEVPVSNGSAPTASGTCPVNSQVGGNTAGTFAANGACSGGTVILTFAQSAPHGWACNAHDLTTPADGIAITSSTTTTATFTGTLANSDVTSFECRAY